MRFFRPIGKYLIHKRHHTTIKMRIRRKVEDDWFRLRKQLLHDALDYLPAQPDVGLGPYDYPSLFRSTAL